MSSKSPAQSDWSKLFCSASIGTLAVMLAPEAHAACVTVNDTTTCTGATTGEQRIDDDNQTFIVDTGATLEAVGPSTVRLNGEDNVFINRGTVTRTGNGNVVGLTSTSGSITGTNEGTINYLGADIGFRSGLNGQSTTGNIIFTNTSTGVIDSNAGGMIARVTGASGNALVDNQGTITARSAASAGLSARTGGGDASVLNSGSVVFDAGTATGGFGVLARSDSGNARVDNSGMVTATAEQVRAIEVVLGSGTGTAEIVNSGDVQSNGDNGRGLRIRSEGTAAGLTLTNSGTVATTGTTHHAVAIEEGALAGATTVNLTNTSTGVVTTQSASAVGLLADNASDDATTTITNAGSVTTNGANAEGIFARQAGGTLDIVNSGTITTTDASASAIQVLNTSGAVSITNSGMLSIANGEVIDVDMVNGSLSLDLTAGSTVEATAASRSGRVIDVDLDQGDIEADFADGAVIDGTTGRGVRLVSAMGDVEVLSAAQITGWDWGLFVGANNGGTARINHAGSITVTDGSGAGITAISSYGGETIVSNSGDIVAGGTGVSGIYASTYQGGNANVVNSGDITTTSDSGHGIHVYSYSALPTDTFSAENQAGGTITTGGATAHGIFVDTNDGQSAEAINAGSINVTGSDSNAIRVQNTFGGISVDNSGILRTVDRSTIAAESDQGDVTITHTGDAEILAISDARAVLFGRTLTGDVTINSTGRVAAGETGLGIVAVGSNGNVTINSGGSITTGGTAIQGSAGDDVTIVSTGDVTVTGTGVGHGIYAISDDGDITVQHDGTIQTAGTNSNGIYAYSYASEGISVVNTGDVGVVGIGSSGVNVYSYAGSNTSSVTVENTQTGTLTAAGDSGHGVEFQLGDGTVNLINAGTISTTGQGGDAVFGTVGTAAVNVTNSGDITAAGVDADGIALTNNDALIAITNSGTVSAADGAAVNLVMTNGTATIDNSGMLTGGADGGTNDEAAILMSLNGTATAVIQNTGTIMSSGDALFITSGTGGAVSLTDSGSVTGNMVFTNTVDTLTLSGTYDGDINLGLLDDALSIDAVAGTAFTGILDGGDGADTLSFSGSGLSFTTTASGFEAVSVTDGLTTFDGGSITGANTFSISSGAALAIADGGASLGVSGDLTNAGALSLSPAATLEVVGGNYVGAAGSTTTFAIDDTSTPQLTADGDISFASGSTVAVDVQTVNTIATGFSFDAAVAGGTLTDGADLTDNSMLFDFEKSVIGGNTLVISIQQTVMLPDAVAGAGYNPVSAAGGLQALIDAGGSAGTALSTAFGRLETDGEVLSGVRDMLPSTSGGLERLATDAVLSVSDAVSRRTSSAHPDKHTTFWVDWVSGSTDADAKGDFEGFEGDHAGFVAGADHRFGSGLSLGAAVFGINGDTADDGLRLDQQETDAAGLNIYAFGQRGNWVLAGQAGFSEMEVDSQRVNALLGEQLTASYDADQSWFEASAARVSNVAGWDLKSGVSISHISTTFDAYTESGGLGALQVDSRDALSQRVAGDLTLTRTFEGASATWTPTLSAGLAKDFGDFGESFSAALVAGGDGFILRQAERTGGAFTAGAGLDVAIGNRFTLGGGVKGEFAGSHDSKFAYFAAKATF